MGLNLGACNMRVGFEPCLQSIAAALEDVLNRRQATRRRHRETIDAIQEEFFMRTRQADNVFQAKADEAARIRRQLIETNADPNCDDADKSLRVDADYFESIRTAETIHSNHRAEISAAKVAAETVADEVRNREYRAATSWFLGVVRREIEGVIREAVAPQEGE